MNVRARLHGRRPAETFDLEFAGLRYIATAAFYPDGSLGEIFIRNHKTGNVSDTAVHDPGILLSLLLQHGCAAETISHAVSRNSDGSANGIVGAVVDLILARSP